MSKINGANNFISFKEIIEHAINNDLAEEKCVYKLRNEQKPQEKDSSIKPMISPSSVPGSNHCDWKSTRFLSIRVKKQKHLGSPAITLYISDETVKILEKLKRIKSYEKKQAANSAELFTSTVSHEMRTPI